MLILSAVQILKADRHFSLIPPSYNTADFSIPPLILQLLLENAVKHNIVSQNKPLMVEIIQNKDRITVRNNLQEKKSVSYSSEVGLDNIVNRYKYFTDQKVEIIKNNEEFVVEIPLIKNEKIQHTQVHKQTK